MVSLRTRARQAWILIGFALGGPALMADPAEPEPWLALDFQRPSRGAEFRLLGALPAPDGTEVGVRLELDDHPVPSGRCIAVVEKGRFSVRFPVGHARVLPGVYRARAEIHAAGIEREGSVRLRVGSPEEEQEARAEAALWFERCSKELLVLVRSLQAAQQDGALERLAPEWDERFFALRDEVWSTVSRGRFFALYRGAEVEDLATEVTLLELLERQRRDGASPSASDAALRWIHLGQATQRVRRLAGEPPEEAAPIREALTRWLAIARVLLREICQAAPRGETDPAWKESAVRRLATLEQSDLRPAEGLAPFRGVAAAQREVTAVLGELLQQRSPVADREPPACRQATERLSRVESMFVADREQVRRALRDALEALEAAVKARQSGSAGPAAERARAILENVAADPGARFHFGRFLARARTAAGCLTELAALDAPAPALAADRREERSEFFRRTLAEMMACARDLLEHDR